MGISLRNVVKESQESIHGILGFFQIRCTYWISICLSYVFMYEMPFTISD